VKRQIFRRSFVLAFLFALVFDLSRLATAQTGNFTIAQNGKPVGTATSSVTSTGHGYDTRSVVRVAMQGLTYSLSKTEQLTTANHLRHVQLSAVVNNSAVNLTAAPDAAQFLLNVSASGKSSTARLAFHPGALETLLALGVMQNNRDLWVILPKQAGTQAGSIVPVQLATYADEEGTLDGKALSVHHLVATIAGTRTELFSAPDNRLMQAELPQQGFALVRKGFVLTPPAKPGAPPAEQPGAPQTQAPVSQ